MAAFTAGSLSRRLVAGCAAAVLLGLGQAAAMAQVFYRYQDANGHWVFSDRQPMRSSGVAVPGIEGERAGIWLRRNEDRSGDAELVAINRFASWAQIAYRVEASRNLDPEVGKAGNALLPPESETRLMQLTPIAPGTSAEVEFSYQFILGHPGAKHRPEQPYRLPYALFEAYRVSQAYPDALTHAALADRHAIDFELPVGTPVFAARGGIVVDEIGDYAGNGLDRDLDVGRANFVRILHADGTLALYGHLQRGSLRVSPGQRVARGQHIADSGNTGFSSGPHLHFVVQRNRAGAVESVPVSFVGAEGAVIDPRTGDSPVAY